MTLSAIKGNAKPCLYLDGPQIPSHLKDAQPGDKAKLLVHGKVLGLSKRLGGQDSLSLEIVKVAPGEGPGKADPLEPDADDAPAKTQPKRGKAKRKLFGKANAHG